jgi:hypothetical protein
MTNDESRNKNADLALRRAARISVALVQLAALFVTRRP